MISGAGVHCHLGSDLAQLVEDLRAGRGRPFVQSQDMVELDCRCTRVGHVEHTPTDEELGISRKQSRFMGRASRLALAAAQDALRMGGLEDLDEVAVIVGSGTGDTDTHREIHERLERTGTARRVTPVVVPKLMASTVSANLVNVLRTTGPSASVAAACAGGAGTIVTAALLVRDGQAKAALAGGVEVLDLHFHAGFDRMRAYCADADSTPTNGSRPYAADRAGFLFGEGAGVALIERRADAEARGAPIIAVLRGWGLSSDGDGEMVQPSADGAARAMERAIRHAGIDGTDVAYVNTHATSTPAGDVEEARAVWRVLGKQVAYGSTKGFTAHTVSAAGAIEAIFTACMLRDGFIAPCLHATPLDPALADAPPVLQTTPLDGRIAMSNSFGFGGTNACIVLERA